MERAGAVERYPDDAALLGEGLQNCLPDPPYGVRDELDALGLVEFVSGASSDRWFWEMERVFCTSSIEMSMPSAISEGVGSRPSSWSSAEERLPIR